MKLQLMAALILGVGQAASADPNESEAMLRAFQISCKDCTTLQYGDPDADGFTAFTEHPCPSGTVCGPVGTAFSCIPEDSADAAPCSCEGKDDTYIAEPYDPASYIVCLPDGGQSVITCTTGIFTGDTEHPCEEGPKCDETADPKPVQGFNALQSETESCRKYFFCAEVPATAVADAPLVPTYECPEGQVYDTTQLTCVDPCTLAPEPFECAADDSGPFADPEDCTIFHLCFNGVKIGDPIPCPPGEFYSDVETDMKCITGDEATICTTQAKNSNPCYEPYKAECA